MGLSRYRCLEYELIYFTKVELLTCEIISSYDKDMSKNYSSCPSARFNSRNSTHSNLLFQGLCSSTNSCGKQRSLRPKPSELNYQTETFHILFGNVSYTHPHSLSSLHLQPSFFGRLFVMDTHLVTNTHTCVELFLPRTMLMVNTAITHRTAAAAYK